VITLPPFVRRNAEPDIELLPVKEVVMGSFSSVYVETNVWGAIPPQAVKTEAIRPISGILTRFIKISFLKFQLLNNYLVFINTTIEKVLPYYLLEMPKNMEMMLFVILKTHNPNSLKDHWIPLRNA
jgi:hypothetical protein